MLTSNYTSINRIIENIYRDYGFSINKSEAAEWIWEVVGLLGIPAALESKYVDTSIVDYRSDLPVDCFKLENIKDVRTGNLLVKSTDVFHRANKILDLGSSEGQITYLEGPTVVVDARVHDDVASVFVSSSGSNTFNSMNTFTYQEYNGMIYYGYKEGDIQIHYKAFPVDDVGMPKIPDDIKYIRAVQLYLLVKIATRLNIKGQVTDRVLDKFERDYDFAIGAAQGSAKMPNMDEMESIKNMMNRLIPKFTEHSSGFAYLNSKESLKKI